MDNFHQWRWERPAVGASRQPQQALGKSRGGSLYSMAYIQLLSHYKVLFRCVIHASLTLLYRRLPKHAKTQNYRMRHSSSVYS
jgi:hypothetical protein